MGDAEDAYQREHTGRTGRLLLLDKTRFRGLMIGLGIGGGLLVATAAGLAITAATSGLGMIWFGAVSAGLGGALLGSAGVLFSVLRVAVTTEELHVQYGLAGPKVPIDAIVACSVEKYEMMKYGGYGVKARLMEGRFEVAYTMPTAADRVVRVRWREGGSEKSMVFSSDQPDVVLAAIQKAQALRARGAAGARVAIEEDEDEAEAEAEATGDRRAARRTRPED